MTKLTSVYSTICLIPKGLFTYVSTFSIHTLLPLFKVLAHYFTHIHPFCPFLFPVLVIAFFHYYFLIYSINPIIFSTEPQMWFPWLYTFLSSSVISITRFVLFWLPALHIRPMKMLEGLKSLSAEEHWTAEVLGSASLQTRESRGWLWCYLAPLCWSFQIYMQFPLVI